MVMMMMMMVVVVVVVMMTTAKTMIEIVHHRAKTALILNRGGASSSKDMCEGLRQVVWSTLRVQGARLLISVRGMHTHVGSSIAAADRQASLDDADVL